MAPDVGLKGFCQARQAIHAAVGPADPRVNRPRFIILYRLVTDYKYSVPSSSSPPQLNLSSTNDAQRPMPDAQTEHIPTGKIDGTARCRTLMIES